jgi:hypothetical protein
LRDGGKGINSVCRAEKTRDISRSSSRFCRALPTVRIEALREQAYAGTSGPELLRYFVVMACADQ